MRTAFYICALLVLSQAVHSAVTANDDMNGMALRQADATVPPFVGEDLIGDGDTAPGAGGPNMPQVCLDALMLLRCACISGIEIAGLPQPPNVGPFVAFINGLCEPAFGATLPTLTVCNTFMVNTAPNVMNSVSFLTGFVQMCVPSAAGALSGAVSSFLAM